MNLTFKFIMLGSPWFATLGGPMQTVLALVLAASSLDPAPRAAPAARYVLQGRVLDPSGAPVSDARVIAVSIDQRLSPETRTDQDGAFTLNLPPGTFDVKAGATGFLEAVQTVTARDAGSEAREFVLKIAPFGETVTVRAPREYQVEAITSGTKTLTPLRDVPQSVTVTSKEVIPDQ